MIYVICTVDGREFIGDVHKSPEYHLNNSALIELKHPLTIFSDVGTGGFVMEDPLAVSPDEIIKIRCDCVLTFFTPDDDLIEYYKKTYVYLRTIRRDINMASMKEALSEMETFMNNKGLNPNKGALN